MINPRDYIRLVPDFPKPGIQFYDIATLLAAPQAWQHALSSLEAKITPHKPTFLAAVEARGFLVAAPLAQALGCGLMMIRKPGKLPGPTISHSYDLEYGQDTLEAQTGILPTGAQVVVVDDLLATGGTVEAAINVINRLDGKVVAAAVIIELSFLGGRDKLACPLESLIQTD